MVRALGLSLQLTDAHNRDCEPINCDVFLQGARKTVLVLGGSGYLGQFVVQHLLKSCRVGPAMLKSCAYQNGHAAKAGCICRSVSHTIPPHPQVCQNLQASVSLCIVALLIGSEAVHLPPADFGDDVPAFWVRSGALPRLFPPHYSPESLLLSRVPQAFPLAA